MRYYVELKNKDTIIKEQFTDKKDALNYVNNISTLFNYNSIRYFERKYNSNEIYFNTDMIQLLKILINRLHTIENTAIYLNLSRQFISNLLNNNTSFISVKNHDLILDTLFKLQLGYKL